MRPEAERIEDEPDSDTVAEPWDFALQYEECDFGEGDDDGEA